MTEAQNKKKTVELPPNYKPSEKEPYMNELQLEYFRRKLNSWKSELLEESEETLHHLKEQKENNDEWDPDDMTFEIRTRERYRKLIKKIDSALRKIDSGEYGYCEETGEEIGIKRLEARPIATLTIEAQERHENYERQHIDEDDDE